LAHEPILILDPNPISRDQLTEILTAGGYDVYGVKSAHRLVDAVKASPFPAVLLDVWLPNIDRGALLQAIREASPTTAVIMMGEKQVFAWLLKVFREGAADFVLKPFDPIEVHERVHVALAKRQQMLSQQSGIPSGSAPKQAPAIPDLDIDIEELLKSMHNFQEQSLEVFLDLERKNLELERQIASLKDPGQHTVLSRDLRVLVAHTDPSISDELDEVVSTFDSVLESQAQTGGEALDRVGLSKIDVVLVGADLPDIPGSIVASSIKAQYPNIEVVLLEDSGGGEMHVTIVTDSDSEPNAQPISSQQDLINVIKDRCRHCRDRREAREFAQEFKGRHEEYIRSLASLKTRVEHALDELLG
jgi:DNA-binding NtrC family response regulator